MASLAACQRQGGSFLRTLDGVKVLSCVPSPAAAGEKKKGAKPAADAAASAPTFDVVLSDTVLFPEGGGQPTDTGSLLLRDDEGEPVRVLSVSRTPGGIVHRVSREIAPGTEVKTEVDWARRDDVMKHHSGQHLISAVARSTFGWKTLSWWLASAPQECFIEMDAASISAEQLAQLEREVNSWISRGVDMKLHIWDSLAQAQQDAYFTANISKSIPESQEGPIRVIEIPGLEHNPCCGTHLSNTAQLQAIKLTLAAKEKGSWKVFFFAGDRVLTAMHGALEAQRVLSGLLSVAPEAVPMADAVRRLQAELKATNKQLAGALKELAEIDAQRIVASLRGGARVAQMHRDEVGLPYLTAVNDFVADALKAAPAAAAAGADASAPAAPAPFVLLLSSADAAGGKEGAFVLVGDEAKVAALGPELTAKLQGKAGGRKGKMQGKGTGLDAKSRAAAIAWLEEQMRA